MFNHVASYAGDPIFQLGEAFHQDPRSMKVNLTVGLYYNDQGEIPVLESVTLAEQRLAANVRPRPYLPIEGLADYRNGVQTLLFGRGHQAVAEGRVATIQSVGGTGGLKVGGDFLHSAYPDSELWMSNPAWDNHHSIFRGSGIKTHSYTYYDPETKSLLFDQMFAEISQLPPNSIVLLHPCCHNPTGVDLSHEQWLTLIPLLKERHLIPFLDIAYQGFGSGFAEDAFAVRAMADAGLTFLVANSFSKNLSFYSERCGGLSVVCSSRDEADRVMGQLKSVARRTYSTPPSHGGMVTAMVLNDPELYAIWEGEVDEMRRRIADMRQQVHQQLTDRLPEYDSRYFVTQCGMFTYTGFSSQQLEMLRARHGVYIIDSGRISVPGLNTGNIDYFCDAIVDVLQQDAAAH